MKRCSLMFGLMMLLIPLSAHATDTGLTGFNVQRFHPTADDSGIFSLYGTRTPGHLKPVLRFQFQGMGGLLDANDPSTGRKTKLVDQYFGADLTASIGLGNRVDVGLILPVYFYNSAFNVNDGRRIRSIGIGEMLIDSKVWILKDEPRSVGLGLMGRLSLPTGNTGLFMGWNKPTGEFRLILDKSISSFYIVGNVGYRIAPRTRVVDSISNTPWNIIDDDALTFGLGFSYTMPFQNRSWDLMASIHGESITRDFKKSTTPLEVSAGIRKRFDNGLSINLGVSRRIYDAMGAPSYMFFACLSFDSGMRKRDIALHETLSRLRNVNNF